MTEERCTPAPDAAEIEELIAAPKLRAARDFAAADRISRGAHLPRGAHGTGHRDDVASMKSERRYGASPRAQQQQRRQPRRPEGIGGDQVEGRRAVQELLLANRHQVERLYMSDRAATKPLWTLRSDEIFRFDRSRAIRLRRVAAHRCAPGRDRSQRTLETVPIGELFDGEHAFILRARITSPIHET